MFYVHNQDVIREQGKISCWQSKKEDYENLKKDKKRKGEKPADEFA